jgi:hypothetical protein
MLERGDIVRFFYLWKRQADAGEISGRKARPACIVIKAGGTPEALYLFPITSQVPGDDRVSLAFTEIDCRRAGLSFPCWIVLDEYNRVELDKAYDFESMKPVGRISPAFLKKIALTIKNTAQQGRLHAVSRS